MSEWDLCNHRITQLVIKMGKLLRQAKGLPEEKNVTILYEETAILLGIPVMKMSSSNVSRNPTPEESAKSDPSSPLVQICPSCKEKAYYLQGLCKSCKDSENGTYKSVWKCFKCGHSEKSKEHVVTWLNRLGIDYRTQSKKSLGIQTVTDEGLK